LKNTSTESDLYKVNISFLEMLATKVASSSLFSDKSALLLFDFVLFVCNKKRVWRLS
jgi:hypothetical protein